MTRSTGIPALFLSAAFAIVAGVALLVIHARHNDAHDWRPARGALPIVDGATAELVFTPDLQADYEIELEFRLGVATPGIDEFAAPLDVQSPLEVQWQVEEGGTVIASGDAKEASYLTSGGKGLLGRMRRTLLRVPFHLIAGGTLERGIGQFKATLGTEYRVTAKVGKTVPELAAADPHIAVRVHRRIWQRHYDEMLSVADAAFCLIIAGGVLGLFWLLRWIRRRRHREATG